ncbi:MAG TPA: hypothetical protein VF765_03720 [Polyangiaceae bacterium]
MAIAGSPRSVSPGGGAIPPATDERDVYDDLLRDTRGLRREHAAAREAWLARLPLERKVELLFELEILLKGLACFANPRNHPGPPRKTPIVAQDFREHTALAREALGRIVQTCRTLLAERERAFVFQRYLETVLPDDRARTRLVGDAGAQETPEQSLFVLRHAMTNLYEVTAGVTRLQRVPYRLFYALLGVAQREVAACAYFNPLHALEFRPEFDRITNPQMLELIRSVPGEAARRLVALTVLSLFRMLRYLALVERVSREPVGATGDGNASPRRSVAVVYLVLSVLRSDARALSGYLRRRSGPLLAAGYEAEVLRLPATELAGAYDRLRARGAELRDVKATLEGAAANLRLEMRRAFEREFLPLEAAPSLDELATAVARVAANLRPALQNVVMFLGRSLGARLDAAGVFDDRAAQRVLSERLRRDVWMFAQIVRAFALKARSVDASGQERWASSTPLGFVREFMSYFRAMGYPLLRAADYPHIDAFLAAMTNLRDTDLLDPVGLARAVEEAERFHAFLSALFDAIGGRDELVGIEFDRRAAAEALKLYLGD